MMKMENLLDIITTLSHEFGTPDFIKGGGGNTSAKTAETLWVKPSGTTLGGLTPERFVAMDRSKLAALYTAVLPAGSAEREARVKDLTAAAIRPGSSGRPSVEAPLHDILAGTFVIHTHPALVNGMTCARNGAAACARLFPQALWVPYVDPGFTLCMEVRRRYRGESIVILENHGIFVTGNTADEMRGSYRNVLDVLKAEYAKAGISTKLQGKVPAEVEPVTPDHIVYGKKPNLGPEMAADAALIRQLAPAFGGMQLLTEPARRFIETWEAEAYRQKQV